ncbi:hypothetical protein IQ07DRAFT_50752 [Pyrenochaeta sp. DS3sAY3a]|nr:hypothetical protein IQ07DRAFT_50752 [Pyrenochaeta sp. DS3sAY3a]
MVSAPVVNDRGEEFTEAVTVLQQTINGFKEDIEHGCEICVPEQTGEPSDSNSAPVTISLTPANKKIKNQLQRLSDKLRSLASQLAARDQWRMPLQISNTPSATILDIEDLSNATDFLTQLIETDPQPKMPQKSLSRHAWEWDPHWKEYFTVLPQSPVTFLYISLWKSTGGGSVWEHTNMYLNNTVTPESAAEALGAWEDWKWDALWGEWFLEQGDDGDDDDDGDTKFYLYTSQWRYNEHQGWRYVGSIGGVAQ